MKNKLLNLTLILMLVFLYAVFSPVSTVAGPCVDNYQGSIIGWMCKCNTGGANQLCGNSCSGNHPSCPH